MPTFLGRTRVLSGLSRVVGGALICSLASTALALDQGKGIYVVDVQRVISDSELGKAAKATVEAQVKKEEVSLKQMENDLKGLIADFSKQKALLSGQALEKKEEELRRKERDLKQEFEDKKNNLVRRNRTEISRVVAEIDKVIKEIAQQKGYLFVLEKDPRFILYSDPALDATPQIIQALNARKVK